MSAGWRGLEGDGVGAQQEKERVPKGSMAGRIPLREAVKEEGGDCLPAQPQATQSPQQASR